jgi:hypothetical protein
MAGAETVATTAIAARADSVVFFIVLNMMFSFVMTHR